MRRYKIVLLKEEGITKEIVSEDGEWVRYKDVEREAELLLSTRKKSVGRRRALKELNVSYRLRETEWLRTAKRNLAVHKSLTNYRAELNTYRSKCNDLEAALREVLHVTKNS